jgi:protein-tyrosine phosphatase
VIRSVLAAWILAVPLASAGTIDNALCEQTGPASYRLDFRVSDGGPVTVYASSSADKIDTSKPVAVIRKSPAEVSVPGRTGRVYFHLKPEHGPTRVVSIRRLPLQGAVNFRDLGGYQTADGKYVRWGRIYRSDYLAGLTAADYQYLADLKIGLVCDLRTDFERKRSPTTWQGKAPEFLVVPVGDDKSIGASMAAFKSALESGEVSQASAGDSGYADMLFIYRDQYARVLHRIADGAEPVLTHCSGGADRTGVYAALLLAALGVPREVILDDYNLTPRYFLDEKNLKTTLKDMQAWAGLDHPPDPSLARAQFGRWSSARIESMFRAIDAKYGSFDAFLKDGLQVSQADVARLRQRLLEP